MLDCWDYIPHKSNFLTPAMPPATAVKAHRYLVARTEPCCKNPLSENYWNSAGFQAPSFRWGLLTVFENTRRAPAKERRLAFCAAKLKVIGVLFPNARKSPSYFVRRHYLFVLPKRLSLKQGAHIETGSVIHRYAMFQSVFYRICCASSISSTIGDAIGRTIH